MRSAYPFISAPSGAIQTIQCKHCNTIMITIIRGKFTEIVCWGGMWCQWQCRCRCYSHMRFFVCMPFYLRIGNKSMLPLIFVCFHLWCRLCAFVVYDIERWHCSFAFFYFLRLWLSFLTVFVSSRMCWLILYLFCHRYLKFTVHSTINVFGCEGTRSFARSRGMKRKHTVSRLVLIFFQLHSESMLNVVNGINVKTKHPSDFECTNSSSYCRLTFDSFAAFFVHFSPTLGFWLLLL